MELRFEPIDHKSALGNIYVGQVENIAANIGAAFVQISAGERCYLQLSDVQDAIYASVKKEDRPIKPGDEILVQINREAMKGKLPAVTTNLNFTGKYLVLTTGGKKFGLSNKLSNDDEADSANGGRREFTVRIRNMVLSCVPMQQMHPRKSFCGSWNILNHCTEKYLLPENPVPALAVFIKQNPFIFLQSGTLTAEAWKRF